MIRPIVLFNHPKDVLAARAFKAALNLAIDTDQCEIWQRGEDETANDDLSAQIMEKLGTALAVIFVVSAHGTNDAALSGPENTLIWQRRETADHDFGRLVVRLPEAPERENFPPAIAGWVHVDATSLSDFSTVVARIVKMLTIPKRFQGLAIDEAAKVLPEGPGRGDVVEELEQTAEMISTGKPISFLLGPYASADGDDDLSCPSYIRRHLLELITDPALRRILVPPKDEPDAPDPVPMLWQDHLATICLLGGSSREKVVDVIQRSVREAAGGAKGTPRGLFRSIAALAAQLQPLGLLKTAATPGLTIISVCPGLRMERALVAAKCHFERATMRFETEKGIDLHHKVYRPDKDFAAIALNGGKLFMPEAMEPKTADQLDFIRLVKPFGSWDLEPGVPSGDLGQAYDALSQLKTRLDTLVSAAGSGPYVVLGGGLGTPPMQAVHALLLRDALERAERRPLLAIAAPESRSPDPLRQLEINRVKNISPRKLKILSSDPVAFVDALTVAFGGEAPSKTADPPPTPQQAQPSASAVAR